MRVSIAVLVAAVTPASAANGGSTRPPPTPKQDALVVKVDGGFHWADAAIGGAAGFGAAITLVGGLALTGRRDRAVLRPPLRREERP
jgi:hypothetical protein